MPDTDPAAAFFPGVDPDEIDLYAVLSLSKTATDSEIKSAYRRLALLHHPDKVKQSASGGETRTAEEAHAKFQQIGFAYSVLKDETRRKRYDESGRTDEGSGAGAKTEAEWKDYFRELWSGEVNGATIDEFTKKYQGSDEEKQDVLLAYTSSAGSLDTMLTTIMCSTIDDEDRFITLINEAISSGDLKATPAWKKTSKDTKAREKRKSKATKEAKEAEEYAKELGVHDKLYGSGAKAKGKGKGKGKADDDDEAGLKALIQGNQAKRMDAMMASLEEKYGGGSGGGGGKKGAGKKRSSKGGEDDEPRKKGKKEKEPTDEEFERIQAEMDARRAKSKKGK